MTEQDMDNLAAQYALIKGEWPNLAPDDLIAIITDRLGLDAEARSTPRTKR
jgi:hypothetical protein